MDNPPTSPPISRRLAIQTLGLGALALSLGLGTRGVAAAPRPVVPQASGTPLAFELPPLGYDYAALEPHFDARTMEIHHTRHHQAYINSARQLLEPTGRADALADTEAVVRGLASFPESIRGGLRNHAGGHHNHALFWTILSPNGGGAPTGDLAAAIERDLGGWPAAKEAFTRAATTRFGSGWAWLTVAEGKLAITSTANQDSPLMTGTTPILGLDVWEHAYYLKYQNRRADFVAAFWELVNWPEVARRHQAALAA